MAVNMSEALKAGERILGYEIVRAVGQGGFGIVYEAKSEEGRRVAIKEYFPAGMVERRGREVVLRNEKDRKIFSTVFALFKFSTGRLIGLADHPVINKTIGFDERNATAYRIMGFIDGETLAEGFDRGTLKLDKDRFRAIFEPVTDALGFLHAHDILHRDIAPGNIMLTREGKPVLIDVDAMREMKQELQKSDIHSRAIGIGSGSSRSLVIANMAYCPPEQLRKTNLRETPATDVYALGATMYDALTGRPPVPAMDRLLARGNQEADPYEPVGPKARFACPPELFETVDRMLSFTMADRPQSMSAFRRAVGWQAPASDQQQQQQTKPRPNSGGRVPPIAEEKATFVLPSNGGQGGGAAGERPTIMSPPPAAARPTPPPHAEPVQPPPPVPETPGRSYAWPIMAVLTIVGVGGFLGYHWGQGGRTFSGVAVPLPKMSTSIPGSKSGTPSTGTPPAGTPAAKLCDSEARFRDAAARGLQALEFFVEECQRSGGSMREEAERRLAEMRRQPPPVDETALRREREVAAFTEATSCLAGANPCRSASLDACVSRYSVRVDGPLNRAGELRSLATRYAAACALPDGTYSGVRGYSKHNPPHCLSSYDMYGIEIRDGQIIFKSDGRTWTGTVNQRSGDIDIPFSGISVNDQGSALKHETYIRGNFRSATLYNGFCGGGFFRINK